VLYGGVRGVDSACPHGVGSDGCAGCGLCEWSPSDRGACRVSATEAELGLLMVQAQELLESPGQGAFDLGLTPELVKADLLGPAEDGDALLARRAVPERPGKRVDRDVVTPGEGRGHRV
jgi:hypothetical protein